MMGWAWGFSIYYTCVYIVRKSLTKFFNTLHTHTPFSLFMSPFVQYYLWMQVVALGLFYYCSQVHSAPEEWFENIKKNCAVTQK